MAENKARNIGIPGIESPKDTCDDEFCPFHGIIGVGGRTFSAQVASVKTGKTAVVVWQRRLYVPKYERFEQRKSKVNAHAPLCLHIKKGDNVIIGECRPLSKTKRFVVIGKTEVENR